jgi:hypothetical protein
VDEPAGKSCCSSRTNQTRELKWLFALMERAT